MLRIFNRINIPEEEAEIKAVRSRGAGGQNVNKVSSAAHLRFDIAASSLPESYKKRLLKMKDRRISKDGIIIIKAREHKSLAKNREDALNRLCALIKKAAAVPKKRKPTSPTKSSQAKRLDAKVRRGRLKALRRDKSSTQCH